MTEMIVTVSVCLITCSVFWYKWHIANQTKNLLIKQNLVYLVTFTNYMTWVHSSFKENLIAVVGRNPELLEFFEKSGTSTKVFLEVFEKPATIVHNQMIDESNKCLEDIKKPLEREIVALIDGGN